MSNKKQVELNVEEAYAFEAALIRAVNAFQIKWNRKPTSILLGPYDYLSLRTACFARVFHDTPLMEEKERFENAQKISSNLSSFMGLPVLPKRGMGLDFGIPPEMAATLIALEPTDGKKAGN